MKCMYDVVLSFNTVQTVTVFASDSEDAREIAKSRVKDNRNNVCEIRDIEVLDVFDVQPESVSCNITEIAGINMTYGEYRAICDELNIDLLEFDNVNPADILRKLNYLRSTDK